MKLAIPAAIGTALTALIVTTTLNAISTAGPVTHAPPGPGALLWAQENDTTMSAFDHAAYDVTLPQRGTLTYDIFSRNGEMTIVVMPANEKQHWTNHESVRELSREEDHTSGAKTITLSEGQYVIGLECENWWEHCPYDMIINVRGPST